MKILITAFEPFDNETTNASLETLRALPEAADVERFGLCVPVSFLDCTDRVLEAVARFSPDALIMLGQAGGRNRVTPERFAYNLDDARIPDNRRDKPVKKKILAAGPDRVCTGLPADLIARRIREAGIPCAVSEDPGRFVCNHLMYTVLYELAQRSSAVAAGFIHLPYLAEQGMADQPSITRKEAVKAVCTVIEVLKGEWEKK